MDMLGDAGLDGTRGDEALDGARGDGADHVAAPVEADEQLFLYGIATALCRARPR